jgi:hypothetical protein
MPGDKPRRTSKSKPNVSMARKRQIAAHEPRRANRLNTQHPLARKRKALFNRFISFFLRLHKKSAPKLFENLSCLYRRGLSPGIARRCVKFAEHIKTHFLSILKRKKKDITLCNMYSSAKN